MLSEVPALVDFLFLEDAPIDEASWQKAIAGDEAAPADPGGGAGGLRRVRVGQGRAARGDAEIAEAAGRKLGKAQAPIRVAVMGRTTGLPLFDSLAVLGRRRDVPADRRRRWPG